MQVVNMIFEWSDLIMMHFIGVIDFFCMAVKDIPLLGPILDAGNNFLGGILDSIFNTELFAHIFDYSLIELLMGPGLVFLIITKIVCWVWDFIPLL